MTRGRGRGSKRALAAVWLAACGGAGAPDGPSAGGGPESPERAGAAGGASAAPAPAVVIDGRFDDWEAVETAARWTDDGSAAVLLTDDAPALYLSIAFGRPLNVQGMDGALLLALDLDGDGGTGVAAWGLPGIDLVISFTRRGATSFDGEGVAAWSPDPSAPEDTATPARAVGPYAIGLWFEPRHTSDRAELRLVRGPPSGLPTSCCGDRVRGRVLVVGADGGIVRRTDPFEYGLQAGHGGPGGGVAGAPSGGASPARPDPGAVLPLRASGELRLVSWNVSRGRFVDEPAPVRRILAALDPDLVLLDEVPPAVTAAEVRAVLPGVSGGQAEWAIHVGSSGSRQRSVIAARGEVSGAPAFERVPYPDSARSLLGRMAPTRALPFRLNVSGAGVPATGAWIRIGGRRVLAVTLDLICCGNSRSSPEDRVRRIEADAIRRAATRAMRSEGPADAVIVGGDFNLVGSPDPLELIGRGLAPGGGDLAPVRALQLDGRSDATWRGPETPFPPGRLDYVLLGGGFAATRAFVFETADLASDALEALGLRAEESEIASDHLPVVVDLVAR